MQPVTIKNKQYTNCLWVSQLSLLLVTVASIVIGLTNNPLFLILMSLSMLFLVLNHRTIKQQANLQFSMRTNGQLMIVDQFSEHDSSMTTNFDSEVISLKGDKLTAEVLAFWYLPHILMLKVKAKSFNKPLFLTVFRPVLGHQQFSHLLVGITQLNVSLKDSLHKNHH